MAVQTGRANDNGNVQIDFKRCTACGLCVRVCKGGPLRIENGAVALDPSHGLGCFACGHCVAVCPQNCITVEGRDLRADDILDLPPREAKASFAQFEALLRSRRSVREFQNKDVPRDVVEQILSAASTAPMGIPPSDVEVLVLHGREKVAEFRADLLLAMKPMRRMFSAPMLALWRPFLGKEVCDLFRTFLVPAIDMFLEKDRQGEDWFAYNAPLGMLFYGAPTTDAADPLIAATYAMLAAETLGLGSCILGFPAPLLKQNRKLKAKYGLSPKASLGTFLIFGYPALRFRHAIRRRFAGVHYR